MRYQRSEAGAADADGPRASSRQTGEPHPSGDAEGVVGVSGDGPLSVRRARSAVTAWLVVAVALTIALWLAGASGNAEFTAVIAAFLAIVVLAMTIGAPPTPDRSNGDVATHTAPEIR